MKKYAFVFLMPLVTACFKKELPVLKPTIDAQTGQVSVGADYGNQIFYDLETNSILRINNREIWDLAFEAGEDGSHILLNGARIMSAAISTVSDITALTSDAGLSFKWDDPSGHFDLTILNDWQTTNKVYAIDLGSDVLGVNLGKCKIKIVSVNDSEYVIQFAPLTSTSYHTFTVPKSTTAGFTYFSMSGAGSILDIEPKKEEWDLIFTNYCHLFDDHTPYSVVGVLSNRYGVKVQEVSIPFATLSYSDIVEASFEDRIDVIGYDWKTYNFDTGSYQINSNKTYVVKTINGRYFKMRFIDFYDDNGVKGAPKFELQELIP